MALQNESSRLNDKGTLITYSTSDSIISDQFRTIRTNIKFLPIKKKNRIILITSPDKGDGKSITTANLAVSMAQQDEKVLLIDASLRDPVLHKLFKISNQNGLADILTRKKSFQEVIYQTNIGKLDILTSGVSFSNPAELIESDSMANLLDEISSLYSFILIDSPSVLKSTETRVLANQADGVILIINHRKTKRAKIVESRKILELVNAKLVGAIINRR